MQAATDPKVRLVSRSGVRSILANALPYAQGFEIKTAILKKPQASRIRKAQGYRK